MIISYQRDKSYFLFIFFFFLDLDLKSLLEEAFEVTIAMEQNYRDTVKTNKRLPTFEEIAIAEMLIASQEKNNTIAVWKDTLEHTIKPYRYNILNQITAIKPDAASWTTKYMIVSYLLNIL